MTFHNKCAQKQFYCKICMQTIFNIDSFVLFVIQAEVLCRIKCYLIYESNKRFCPKDKNLYSQLLCRYNCNLAFIIFLLNCQFIQYVNNWPFSSEWNSSKIIDSFCIKRFWSAKLSRSVQITQNVLISALFKKWEKGAQNWIFPIFLYHHDKFIITWNKILLIY